MQPFEFHGDSSETEPNETNEEHKKLIKAILSVACVNGDYYIYQGQSMKHGIGMGIKCKTDRYFITDVIEKLTQKAFVVVADAVIDELKCKRDKFVEEEDDRDPSNGVIVRAGDVIRFGRVCYLVKETSVDIENRAVREISKKQTKKQITKA